MTHPTVEPITDAMIEAKLLKVREFLLSEYRSGEAEANGLPVGRECIPAWNALHDALDMLTAMRSTASQEPDDDPLGDGTDFGVTGEWWGQEPVADDDALIARLLGFAAAMREYNPRLVSAGYGGFSFGPDDYEAIATRLKAQEPVADDDAEAMLLAKVGDLVHEKLALLHAMQPAIGRLAAWEAGKAERHPDWVMPDNKRLEIRCGDLRQLRDAATRLQTKAPEGEG